MSEEFINISDGEEEMRQLFQESCVRNNKNTVTGCDTNQDSITPANNGANNSNVSAQSESKKKTPRKSANSRQRSSSSTSTSKGEGSSRSSSARKGRQSKTPSGSRHGRDSHGEGEYSISPCKDSLPTFTSDIHVTDNNFKLSLLDEVLTEKKMALMKSPEVVKFLKEQQSGMLATSKQKYEPSGS
ncbi:hypothetical protein SNE40_016896 [Patella caerulea]|uniref:Regulatory factor X-associated protein RFXANK-binding domain-containing protein n=1 Tax=Patella caerulea TaxID=87958 RepID=A0AAN8JFQ0_PATCE